MHRLSHELFFDLASFKHQTLFSKGEPVWNTLKHLKAYLDSYALGVVECDLPETAVLENPELISIGKGTVIEPGVYIQGPCVIGENCILRHGCYVRPYVLTGDNCVIGHATEAKHAIFLNGAKAPHFNYVGDSILGNGVNLGAGVICANFRLDQKPVPIRVKDEMFSTGLEKLGVIVGDGSQVGCNAALSPGLLLKKKSLIRPGSSVLESSCAL